MGCISYKNGGKNKNNNNKLFAKQTTNTQPDNIAVNIDESNPSISESSSDSPLELIEPYYTPQQRKIQRLFFRAFYEQEQLASRMQFTKSNEEKLYSNKEILKCNQCQNTHDIRIKKMFFQAFYKQEIANCQ